MAGEKTCIADTDKFARNVALCIREKQVENLINIVKQLNVHEDNASVLHQKISEYCLKDITSSISQEPCDSAITFLMWSILNVISSSTLVRKQLWKEQNLLQLLYNSLELSIKKSNKKLQKATTSLLSTILIGASNTYFDTVAELKFIQLLLVIIRSDCFVEETFKHTICCFSLLCDGTDTCKQQLIDLKVADTMLKMGETHALIDEDLCNLAALTYDDLLALKMSHSIGRKKFLKTKVSDEVFCSNPVCLTPQQDVKFKKCSRCKMTFYCSKECQVEHWKRGGHHKICTISS